MPKVIVVFGFKHVVAPPEGMPIVDCRGIKNPYGGKSMEAMRLKVRTDPAFNDIVAKGVAALRSGDSVAIGCAFGVHRSGTVAEAVARKTGATIKRFADYQKDKQRETNGRAKVLQSNERGQRTGIN